MSVSPVKQNCSVPTEPLSQKDRYILPTPSTSAVIKAIVEHNFLAMQSAFAQGDVNPNHLMPNGNRLLHFAVIQNNLEAVKELLKQGAPIDEITLVPPIFYYQKCPGSTALGTAVDEYTDKKKPTTSKSLSIINTLVQHKADPNIGVEGGITSLEIAIHAEDAELCYLLIDAKADVNLKSPERNGRTLLDLAANCYSPNPVMTEGLLALKADPNLCFPPYIVRRRGTIHPFLTYLEERSEKTSDRKFSSASSPSSYAERPTAAPSPLEGQTVAATYEKIFALHQAVVFADYPVFLTLLTSRADPLASNLEGRITLESEAKKTLENNKLLHIKSSRKSKKKSTKWTPKALQQLQHQIAISQKISDIIAMYKSNRELGFAYCLDEKKISGSSTYT